jgi:hypothetical protein
MTCTDESPSASKIHNWPRWGQGGTVATATNLWCHRADAEADRALDAGMDRVHDLVSRALGADAALVRLEEEAAGARVELSGRTRQRVTLALENTAERHAGFAEELARAVEQVQAPALDDVTPLLGDHETPGVERGWERLRFALYRSAGPDSTIGHQTLTVLALLGEPAPAAPATGSPDQPISQTIELASVAMGRFRRNQTPLRRPRHGRWASDRCPTEASSGPRSLGRCPIGGFTCLSLDRRRLPTSTGRRGCRGPGSAARRQPPGARRLFWYAFHVNYFAVGRGSLLHRLTT